MRKGVALYGASEDALALVPLLEANPTLEIAAVSEHGPQHVHADAEFRVVGVEQFAPDGQRALQELLRTGQLALNELLAPEVVELLREPDQVAERPPQPVQLPDQHGVERAPVRGLEQSVQS